MNEEIKQFWIKLGFIIFVDSDYWFAAKANPFRYNFLIASESPLGHTVYYRYDNGKRIPMTEQDMLSYIRMQAFL